MLRALAGAPHGLVSTEHLPTELARASLIADTYRVQRRIGSGGMGDVYLATDLRLHRPVAVKLASGRRGGAARDLAVREARMMAQVCHPNVVQVYEVGVHAGDPFIAMEYVEGTSAADWMLDAPRSWREILTVYRQAGLALAAAHEAGVVHGDFKPANVLIARDRRVRVADFGLSRLRFADTPRCSSDDELVQGRSRSTAVAGTLGFIAPEQYEGAAPDPRSDQFALCVSVWTTVYGAPPFAGSPAQVRAMAASGTIAPPRRDDAPAWLRSVLERGLRPDAAERYADMHALVRALDPARHRRVWWIVGAFSIAAIIMLALGPRSEHTACDALATTMKTVWNRDRSRAIADAVGATGIADANETGARLTVSIDAWAQQWWQARKTACAAAEPAPMACLADGLSELDAVIETLSEGTTPEAVARVPDLLGYVRAPARCLDGDLVTDALPLPSPVDRDAVTAVRRDLDRSRAHRLAGDHGFALRLAEEAIAAARDVGYRPVLAEAEFAGAQASLAATDVEGAVALAERAFTHATEHDAVAADAATLIASRIAHLEGPEVAELWSRAAEAAEVRAGRDPVPSWRLLEARAMLAFRLLDRGSARMLLERAREQLAVSPDVHAVAPIRLEVRLAQVDRADSPTRAEATLSTLLVRAKRELGSFHPLVSEILGALCDAQLEGGRVAAARTTAEESLALVRAVYGDRSRPAAQAHAGLAEVHWFAQDAHATLDSALEALEITRSPEAAEPHTEAVALGLAGSALGDLGRTEESLQMLRDSARIFEEHAHWYDVMVAYSKLSNALRGAGRWEEAKRASDHAIQLLEVDDAPAIPKVGAFVSRSMINVALGDNDGALADLERAEDLLAGAGVVDISTTAKVASARGSVLYAMGRWAESIEWYERSVEFDQQIAEGGTSGSVVPLMNVALAALELGRLAQAEATARRTLALLEALGGDRVRQRARTKLTLGRARYRQGARREGLSLAIEAERELVSAGIHDDLLEEVRAWVRHPR